MLDFTVRFILASLKLILKVTLIIGGLVFSSLGNAFLAFLETDHKTDENPSENYNLKGFVQDEQTAMREFTQGNISESEMGNYWGIGEKN